MNLWRKNGKSRGDAYLVWLKGLVQFKGETQRVTVMYKNVMKIVNTRKGSLGVD